MKRVIIRDFIIIVIIFGAIWGIFSVFPIFPDKTVKVSIEKEEDLGNYIVKEFFKNPEYSKVQNKLIDSAIYVVFQRLKNNIGLTNYDYNFIVFNHSMVNAFTLPGGNILISTGLISFTQSPEELAVIMAHEIGHVENRHIISKLIKEIGISILLSGDKSLIREISKTTTSTAFDRKQEKEADQYALDLLYRSGINPKIMAELFRRIDRELGSFDKKAEILMTHPHNNSRIKSALEYKIEDDFKEIEFNLDWDKISSIY